MPFASVPAAEQTTPRDKRRIAAVIAVILLLLAAIAVWAAFRPGAYGASKSGCITVNIASSTGGAILHQCGKTAKTTCQHAYTGTDRLSALIRPQCKLAGISQASTASAG
jgi:hypothetical protein